MNNLTASQKAFRSKLTEEVESSNGDMFLAIARMHSHCTKSNLRLQHINKYLTPQQRNEVISNVLVLLLK